MKKQKDKKLTEDFTIKPLDVTQRESLKYI